MKSKWWKVLFLLIQIVLDVYAATHWVVTENGRIQSQASEMFAILRLCFETLLLLHPTITNITGSLNKRLANLPVLVYSSANITRIEV